MPTRRGSETIIVVAPHEFFATSQGARWVKWLQKARFFVLNMEPPHSPAFSRGLRYCLCSDGIIDMTPQNIHFFGRANLKACFYLPGFRENNPLYDRFDPRAQPLLSGYPDLLALPRDAAPLSAPRPIDVSFSGDASARRDRFFAGCAPVLARWRCVIDYRKGLARPTLRRQEGAASERGLGHFLARHSKIYLNVFPEDPGFFEAHSMVLQGFANGAAVVSDAVFEHPDFEPGIHYFRGDARELPGLIGWLLESRDGREKLQAVGAAGHLRYASRCTLGAVGGALGDFFCSGFLHDR